MIVCGALEEPIGWLENVSIFVESANTGIVVLGENFIRKPPEPSPNGYTPGVMGKLVSGVDESFSEGLLEYPQYTRPQAFEGRQIPDILTSGDHAKVAAWRQAEAEALTRQRRPDLWANRADPKAGQIRPKSKTDG